MNKQELQNIIAACHEDGKKVALSFCSHVPQEILEAAGLCSLRIPYMQDLKDSASQILILLTYIRKHGFHGIMF